MTIIKIDDIYGLQYPKDYKDEIFEEVKFVGMLGDNP